MNKYKFAMATAIFVMGIVVGHSMTATTAANNESKLSLTSEDESNIKLRAFPDETVRDAV